LVRRAAERIAAYQGLNHTDNLRAGLARWGLAQTPPASSLAWWEICAAGASSLDALALISAAANPDLSSQDALAIDHAYFPWIGLCIPCSTAPSTTPKTPKPGSSA
jgi:hypothetical protein